MNGGRTRAWWMVRIQLGVGIVLTLLVVRLGVDGAMTIRSGNPPAQMPPIPPTMAVVIAAVAVAVVGLVWMARIIRGRTDDPPRWRYRDR